MPPQPPLPQLEELRQAYVGLCQRLYPAQTEWLFQTAASHDGVPHIEFREGEYHYIGTDRGVEVMHKVTADKTEMLYWLVRDMTWGMAVGYEFRHRIPGQSFRRLLFAKHLEYMTQVDMAWAERLRQEIEAILAVHPYDDVREG